MKQPLTCASNSLAVSKLVKKVNQHYKLAHDFSKMIQMWEIMFPVFKCGQGQLSSIQSVNELAPDTPESKTLTCLHCLEGQSIGEDKGKNECLERLLATYQTGTQGRIWSNSIRQ